MKREEREQAKALRYKGWSLRRISEALRVSKSSVSLWVRDIPQPVHFTREYQAQKRRERLQKIEVDRAERSRLKKEQRVTRKLGPTGHVLIRTPEGYEGTTYEKRQFIFQHRYLIEQKLGRLLSKEEIVHHKNGDPTDNHLENLELMSRSAHSIQHAQDRYWATHISLECPTCGSMFVRRVSYVKRGSRAEQQGFYCSRSCAGKARKATG